MGYQVPQGAVAVGALGDALQGVAVDYLVAAGAGAGVVAGDGLVAEVEFGDAVGLGAGLGLKSTGGEALST